jgi:hypothetical protein
MRSSPTLAAVSFEKILKEDMRRRAARELSGARAPRQHVKIVGKARLTNLAMGAGDDPTPQESSDFIISGVTGNLKLLFIFILSHVNYY